MSRLLRCPQLAAALLSSCVLFSAPALAADRSFDIPAQSLAGALTSWAQQAHVQIFFPSDAIRGMQSRPIKGAMPERAALDRLIADTGLGIASDDGKTVVLAGKRVSAADMGASLTANEGTADDSIVVTGSVLRTKEAIVNRRNSLGVVDTLSQDDTGDLADETLAAALVRVPGVTSMQTLYGEQEAAYVSTRGITPDLNFVSFDGIAMFSAANDGEGTRRVDLNLIPTQISRTTEVYKSFTPDLDAGAIGSVINIVPYSALNGKQTFYIDAQVNYQEGHGHYVPGDNSLGRYNNSPWSGGVKGLWVRRFGADDQFGIVLSGIYRQRTFDYSKRNANGRVFYTPAGTAAKADLSNWDGQQPLPSLIRPMDYTHFTRTYGGSAQFEWRASDTLQMSIMGFNYKQLEDQTLNQFYVEQYSNLVRTGPETSTLKIGRTRTSYDYDRFETESRGAIAKLRKDFSDDTSLEIRGGYGLNKFYDEDLGVIYAYAPKNAYINYDMSELTDKISITNNDELLDPASYKLDSASDFTVRARMTSYEGRADFKTNFGSNSTGFGLAAGFDGRHVKAQRDKTQTTYTTNGSALGSLGFIPDLSSHLYNYPYLWIDYAGFRDTVKPGLAVNTASSRNASFSDDYAYAETVLAAYASVMYATDRTRVIAGLRIDDVDFTADVPQATGSTYTGAFQRYNGQYRHVLPSVNITQNLTDTFRLKAAYSRSLGRPAFSDIAQAESTNVQNLTISRGNPNLRPRVSDNFDLAVEKYFADGNGLVSLSGFYKNIKDNIYTLSTDEVINGQTYTVTTPMNASSAKMRGFEFQIVHDKIPGLPGIFRDKVGVSINATRMWAEMDYVAGGTFVHLDALQYQPNWLVNATAFYRLPHDGELRIAYSWKSKSPISLGQYPWTTYWLFPQGQLDLAARYSITKNVIVKLQANNILGQDLRQGYLDPFAMQRYELTRNRSYSFDLIWKM